MTNVLKVKNWTTEYRCVKVFIIIKYDYIRIIFKDYVQDFGPADWPSTNYFFKVDLTRVLLIGLCLTHKITWKIHRFLVQQRQLSVRFLLSYCEIRFRSPLSQDWMDNFSPDPQFHCSEKMFSYSHRDMLMGWNYNSSTLVNKREHNRPLF